MAAEVTDSMEGTDQEPTAIRIVQNWYEELRSQARPEILVATTKSKLMMSLAKEFGFTPGPRSGIAIVRDEAAERNPIEAAREALRRHRISESAQNLRIAVEKCVQ